MNGDGRETTRILIVEDEEIVAQDIHQVLESLGYTVTSHVTTGEEAVAKAEADVPNIILMDIKLAGDMNGIEAAEIIQRKFAIPVIFLTAYVDDETLNRAKITDPFGYVSKPFKDRDLLSAVEIARQRSTTQKALCEREDQFRSIIEGNADAIIITDERGTILFANTAAESIFACPVADMIGGDFGFSLSDSVQQERDITGQDGRVTPVELRVASMQYKGKSAYIAALRDIADRKNAEAETRRQQARIRSVFEHSREGMVTLDTEDRIVTVNRSFETLFGYTEEELRGRNIVECLAPGQDDVTSQNVKETVRLSIGMEAHRRRKDGTMIDVSISGGPIVVDGEREGFFVIYRDIGKQKQAEREIMRNYETIQSVLEGTAQALATAVELRDPYTAGHQHRVTRLACAIADEINLDDDHVKGIRIAASIHDIGKIHVPAEILSKPDALTDMEFNIVKLHPRVGYGLLKNIDFPWPIADIIHQHHERLDGSGYPQGLTEKDILTESKVLSVADVVEAMISHRPYRTALGIDAALDEIRAGRGTKYDARAVDACVTLFTKRGYTMEDNE